MKPNITLRKYQENAIDRGLWAIKNFEDNSLIVLPTAAGKSLISSGIAERLGKEILILQPSKEILEQNMKKLALYVPEDEIGVYSASFKRKDIKKYTFATIQSVYKVPELFEHIGQVIIDECDLLNPRNEKTMFKSFLSRIDNPTVIGLTATPFRNVNDCVKDKNGDLIRATSLKLVNRMRPQFWKRIAYNINNQELFEQEYLCPLAYYSRTLVDQRKIPTNITMSDFDLDAYSKMLDPYEQEIIESISKARGYVKSILVFCSSVNQAERMSKVITNSACISGATPTKERDRILTEFTQGKIKVVFNVSVLTVGYDYPALDCIYVIRPTKSLRLHLQMLGRGVRTAEGKERCIVIDYSGNYDNMGGVEDYKLMKDGNLWEVYAKGKKRHGVPLFEPSEYSPVRSKIKF